MKLTTSTIMSGLLMAGSLFFGCEGPEGQEGAEGAAGPNGLNALIAAVAEPAGTNCASGGFRINVGSDANKNGTLDASEISSSAYACNGATGTAGSGFLLKTTAEAPGSNCSEGGFKVETGIDDNGDGVLAGDEVTDTQYICEEDTKVATIFEDKSGTPPLVAMSPQFNS